VYWKGDPPDCTLDLHCYTDLFGTFRSTGRGHLRACESVPVQICSVHSAETVRGSPGEYVLQNFWCTFNFDIDCNFKTLKFWKLVPGNRLTTRFQWNVSWHTFAVWSFRNRFEFDGELAVAALFIGMQAQFEWQRSYGSITLRDTVCPVTPLSCVYLLFGWGVVVPVVLRHTWGTVAITILARKLDWNCEESGPIFFYYWIRCVFDVCSVQILFCVDDANVESLRPITLPWVSP
jgi:hypothetical protein